MPVRSWVKKRGRPKHWLKVRPLHFKNTITNPDFQLHVKDAENQWRELRRRGTTDDYFELLEITDPMIMGDEALDWGDAVKIPKYKTALKKLRDAQIRNVQQIKSIALKGARNSKLSAEAKRAQLIDYLHTELYTIAKYDSYSIRRWANEILIGELKKTATRCWCGGRITAPGLTHLRGILKKIRNENQSS